MPFRNDLLAAACALALPFSVSAQQVATDSATTDLASTDPAATDLDEVVVTATRTRRALADSLAPVEVIDRAQIERSQARDLPDLLRGRAGVSLSNQGGAGKLTTLFLRGSESDHVLVLLDGVRVGSATSGLAAFQDFPLGLIDRIEIVRGPRSSLYGSEAIGGVIQIFTRRDRDGVRPRASATVGSHGEAAGDAGIGGSVGRGWFGVDAAYRHTDGFDACQVATPSPFSGGCFISAPEPDDDGYRNRALSLRGGLQAGDTVQVDAHALRAEGRNAFDGDFTNLSKTRQQVVGGRVAWTPSDALTLQVSAGRNTDASDNFLRKVDAFSGAFVERSVGYFDTDRDSATLQGDLALSEGQVLTLGADWLRDRVDSSTVFDRRERDNRAVFAQYQGRAGAHAFEISLRHDDNAQFGSHVTGGAAWGWSFAERWRAIAGYGTAFKAPTFNELYFPFFGNPDLRPEESRSAELGLRFDGARTDWRIDAFETRVEDLIAFDAALGLPNNLDRARLRGIEAGVDVRFAGWDLDASAGWLDTENRSAANDGNALPRRARHNARVQLDRAFGAFRFGVTGVAEGARYDDVANTRRLDPYATLDLRGEFAFARDWTLQARLANVFDERYETASFYRQPGREWFVTLRYAPKGG